MRWLIPVLALLLSSCAAKPLLPEEIDAMKPGTKSDGLVYSWTAYEQSFYGGGHFTMLPDGSVYSMGKRVDKNRKLWLQIETLVQQYSGQERAVIELPDNQRANFLLASYTVQPADGPMCLSHWTEVRLRVKAKGKRAYYRTGRCDDDDASDRAGREIYSLTHRYFWELHRKQTAKR